MSQSYGKDDFDVLISEVLKNNIEKVKGFEIDEIPTLDDVWTGVEEKVSMSKDNSTQKSRKLSIVSYQKKKTNFNLFKKLTMACSIVLISFIFSIVFSTKQAEAFKFNIAKFFVDIKGNISKTLFDDGKEQIIDNLDNSIEKIYTYDQAKKSLDPNILVPKYLPHGYKCKTIIYSRYKDGTKKIEQKYHNGVNYIIFRQLNNLYNQQAKSYVGNLKEEEIGEFKIYHVNNGQKVNQAFFIKNIWSCRIYYEDDISKETFVNIVESIN